MGKASTSATAIAGAIAAALAAGAAQAEIVGEAVTYEVDGESYQGFYARNTALGAGQPVVVIVHDWDGLGDYERRRAEMLAEAGYAAFAVDLYGQGVRPETLEEKRAQSGALYSDRTEMRARLDGSLDQLAELDGVDPGRAVAIGYCFGGSAVLELARSGRALDGFVTFHGGLGTPEGQDYAEVAGPILILHGSRDSVSGMGDLAELAGQLDSEGVTYTMEVYGGARHAFTVWGGDRYQARADLESWSALEAFLDTTLR